MSELEAAFNTFKASWLTIVLAKFMGTKIAWVKDGFYVEVRVYRGKRYLIQYHYTGI